MYKGEVAVILYDEKGNEVHRQENHNLVTNATADMIKMIGGGSGSSSNLMNSVMPIAEKALGGLVLFDDTLTENANKYDIPTTARVVACAGRNQDSTNARAGSLNQSETTKIQGGYQTVWDFNTSQANGSIASLGLTSDYAGDNIFDAFCGENFTLKSASTSSNPIKDSSGQILNPNNIFPLKYDKATQIFYFLLNKGYQGSLYIYSVCYARVPLFEYEVADSFVEIGTAYETSTVIGLSETLDYTCGSVDVKGGYAYIPYAMNWTVTSVKFLKINLSDFTYSDTAQITIAIADGNYKRLIVADGYLYSMIDGEVNRVNIADTSITYKYELKDGSSNLVTPSVHGFVQNSEGLVMAVMISYQNGYKNYALYRDVANTVIAIKNTSASKLFTTQPVVNGMVVMYVGSSELKFAVKRDYLGTIFNLQTPVNKTQATSMKVIYTLTNV